jgi:hypothetical protein
VARPLPLRQLGAPAASSPGEVRCGAFAPTSLISLYFSFSYYRFSLPFFSPRDMIYTLLSCALIQNRKLKTGGEKIE